MLRTCIYLVVYVIADWTAQTAMPRCSEAAERVGFAQIDITPKVSDDRPVWLAGYGMGRKATGIHDPIMARAVVIKSGETKIALVSVDLVGLQYPEVQNIREQLKDFSYVAISSTHNHEGPDVIGIWGRNPLVSGVDRDYLRMVRETIPRVIRTADASSAECDAVYGTATDESLLRDSRDPQVKDGVLRTVGFRAQGKLVGLLVQWSCHPEAMGSKNTLVTADFPAETVAWLQRRYHCPIVYFSGAVGGLMAPPRHVVRDAAGAELSEGDFAYMKAYGEAVGRLAEGAVESAQPLRLSPINVSAMAIAVPVDNRLYLAAREVGTLARPARFWTGDPEQLGETVMDNQVVVDRRLCIESEVAYLRLGDLKIACIPGELYPELVYGAIQDPVDPGADFSDAPREPNVNEVLSGGKWFLLGLANDEVGYIIPKRQWDMEPPFAYGRNKSQYGEINSCGADTAPTLLQALVRRVREVEGR